MSEEMSILSRSVASPPSGYLMFRLRQQATAINFAIMTTPPPTDLDSRLALAQHHMELALLYRQFDYFDLERDALQAARKLVPKGMFPERETTRIANLGTAVDRVEEELQNFTGEQQAGPVQRAEYLISRNMLDRGMREFEEAESQNVGTARVKYRLLDLYCLSGRPDKALEQLGYLNLDDPALVTGPGTASYRHGLMNLLVGNYAKRRRRTGNGALPSRSAGSESADALESVRSMLQRRAARRGESPIQELPSRVRNQADWEFEEGLCQLEGGPALSKPSAHFAQVASSSIPKMAARGASSL